ncbi:hypothetical protein BKH13_02050 [Actinomyces naeslundii]|uniref:Tellurium resistance protein TerC n=2 Tax=Actinomyces naeslundii TaxID=1655 RepID=A0ABX3F1E2_ACTNA|nr:hypothetical protein [Actinomyces naeslundii]OLO85497.1 hypothetical protein BKH13_02050 [Actinomyces naeslundii]
MRHVTTHHRRAQPAARARGASRDSNDGAIPMAPADVRGATDWASVIGAGYSSGSGESAGKPVPSSTMSTGSTGSARSVASGGTAGSAPSARSADSVDTLDVAEDLGYATRRASNRPKEPGLVDPAWTRLSFAGIVPLLLAVGSVLPGWVRLVLVAVLVPAAAQGWPALVRARHDLGGTIVMTISGLAAATSVYLLDDMGVAGLVMAFSILVAFVGQMLRRDGRHNLVEDLSSTVAGCLVVVSGSAWCALEPGLADPAIVVPTCLALFVGAVLTVLNVRARILEVLTVTLPALLAGGAGYVLAAAGFFGLSHISTATALQSAVACVVVGFVAGILMAAGNRVLWTHRWVPGGRAAVASALVPILSVGVPVYAIARLMGGFLAG